MFSNPNCTYMTVRKWYQVFPDSTIYADARMQQLTVPKLASYFEMHVRGCYIVEVYYHVDQH